MKHYLIISILCLGLTNTIFANDQVLSLPGLGKIEQTQYAGYLSTGKKNRVFYWFVTQQSPKTPLILWSNGGPGYSSMYGFFNETGPYYLRKKGRLIRNKHGWNHFSNYLVIDQPAGVGLSLLKSTKLYTEPKSNTQAYYNALISFYKKFPQYVKTPIYLSGESYAGTYLPDLARLIILKNKHARVKINLKGLILVSPWSAPKYQQDQDVRYALLNHLITVKQANKIKKTQIQCDKLLYTHSYTQANVVCGQIDTAIHTYSGRYMANIEKLKGDDNTLLDAYLNNPAVRKATHTLSSLPYHAWSTLVNKRYLPYIQRSNLSAYQRILSDHIPILILSGLSDGKDTNYLGVNSFIHRLDHKQCVQHKLIQHAGHMIPLDQPKVDKVIKHFIHRTHEC